MEPHQHGACQPAQLGIPGGFRHGNGAAHVRLLR
jgi:hypothetical protein